MPNHIKNRIEILGTKDQVKRVVERYNTHHKATLNRAADESIICVGKDGVIGWFNEKTCVFTQRKKSDIIGLPDGFKMEIQDAFDHFPDFNKVIPQPKNIFNGDLGRKEEEMCKREGRPTWYDWNKANWGTKWNSYSCKKESDNIFTFETAWNNVAGIICAMSKLFPKVNFIYEYADEDTGCNCGVIELKNGIFKNNIPINGTKEAYDIAFKLRPHIKDGFVLINNNYEYKEYN